MPDDPCADLLAQPLLRALWQLSWCRPAGPWPRRGRLPISTGAVGIDPRGQVEVYVPPRVVRARVTEWREWPPVMRRWG